MNVEAMVTRLQTPDVAPNLSLAIGLLTESDCATEVSLFMGVLNQACGVDSIVGNQGWLFVTGFNVIGVISVITLDTTVEALGVAGLGLTVS